MKELKNEKAVKEEAIISELQAITSQLENIKKYLKYNIRLMQRRIEQQEKTLLNETEQLKCQIFKLDTITQSMIKR